MAADLTEIRVPSECMKLIRAGALVAVSHSGGKDSQAMTILLSSIVPRDRLIAVHAPLGEVEWPGRRAHREHNPARRAARHGPRHLRQILARTHRGARTLPQQVGPILYQQFEARTHRARAAPLKAHPRFEGQLVNALGLRRDESRDRARRIPWRRNERMSVAGREVFDWLPAFELTTEDVFRVIAEAGQSPHPVYSFGLTRCSCSFCIFASRSDLRRAAKLRPDLYAKYAQLERRIAHTLSPTRKYLLELTGIPVDSAVRTPLRHRALKGDRPARPRARSVSS